ncbi:hypothetical protein [Archangium lansingense]|uniref:Uncharacterized protein n=1 Tax=Archangium lansingense TaxID=2995310 RepID=A0ABT4AKE4_9BACT|nr:hypothetical protein [Archangium lansinium]MCY1082170.1 hypothetical protein [Archangium lansinium]
MRTHPLTAMSVSVLLLISASAAAQTEASAEPGTEETRSAQALEAHDG